MLNNCIRLLLLRVLLQCDVATVRSAECCRGRSLIISPTVGMGLSNQLLVWAGGIKLAAELKRSACLIGMNNFLKNIPTGHHG